MHRSTRLITVFASTVIALSALAEEITVHRDEFGIPHIFAESEEGCAYAMGYVQGEDRLVGVLENYMRAAGRMAEAYGEREYNEDVKTRMWQHYAKSEEHYMKKSAKIRAITEAYVAGLKQYMADHPEAVPDWAPEITPYFISAVGRHLIWGWPEGEAAGDLRRGGLRYTPDEQYRGSNQWLIAPDRTADGNVIALIDPHLSWYGFFRFYEARYYGGELAYSGMAVPGLPLGTLGHSRYCSVAMTTGGPDTSDVFFYPVNPDNPLQYKYDGEWRDMKVVKERIGVRTDMGMDWREVEYHYAHLGPVVARQDGNAYVMAMPYWDEIYHIDQVYAMNTARNMKDMMKAFDMRQYMAQNIMVGTVDGDIFYLRNGRVPIRPEGFDYTMPVPGEDPKSEWLGIHEIKDLVQVRNPKQGYMQNCNVSPFAMMKDSPMLPEDYPAYIYNADRTPSHQRAAMTLEQIHAGQHVTVAHAFEIATSTQVYGANQWKARLSVAMASATLSEDANEAARYILAWDEHSRPDSVGATIFKFWKQAITDDLMNDEEKRLDRYGDPPPRRISDAELVAALEKGVAALKEQHGSVLVPYGAVHRVARRHNDGTYGPSFPVGGGNPGYGMATPRNIGFAEQQDGTFIGQSGQTSTQIVVLSDPPKSWTFLPLGNSDDPESPHYDDQAEKLFSPGILKPTYFLSTFFMKKDALMSNITATIDLQYEP